MYYILDNEFKLIYSQDLVDTAMEKAADILIIAPLFRLNLMLISPYK
jgi:hypothetical protein